MKVLFITNIPSPYRIEFFNELGKHCDLTVWFEAKNEANREWEIEGLGRHFRYRFLKGRTFGLDKHLNVSIIRELNAEPFDVYIMGCYSSPTEILAIHWLKLRRKRFILNSDGGFPADAERFLQRKLKTYLISSADLWLSSGINCTNYLKHYGAKPDRIAEYPLSACAASGDELRPLAADERAAFKKAHGLREFVLLGVGQFIPRKGFDVLLRAFGRMQRDLQAYNSSLVLIGGGPERARYEAIIREEGIRNVVIRDFLQRSELLPYWKSADVFALPTRYDVWGLVFNEAASFGLPIVTTAMAGAARDLVRDRDNGFVVPTEDEAALASRLAELAADAALRERFARRSRELAARYSMERMVARHVEILQAWAAEGGFAGHDPERLHLDVPG